MQGSHHPTWCPYKKKEPHFITYIVWEASYLLGRSALVSKLILLKDIFVLSVINSSEDSELSSQTSMNLVYRLTQVTKPIEDVQPTSSSIRMTKLAD
jgi:hypothetical protein